MSFKFTKIERKTFSKESSEIDENELEKENSEEEKINQINNYIINNNLSSMMASHNIKDKDNISLNKSKSDKFNNDFNNENKNVENEQKNIVNDSNKDTFNYQNDGQNKINDTQFYELTTNGLIDKIKNDYEEIYIKQQKDIKEFVEHLAKENSELKLEISKLKIEITNLLIKNEFNSKFDLFPEDSQNAEEINNKIKNGIDLESQKIELEKNKIKEEYNYILNNISSNFISKNVKSLYDQLIKSKNDLLNCLKINIMIQEENEKLKIENNKIKSNLFEEKNKIIDKIIEIQNKLNSDIDINKNILFPIYNNFSFKNHLNKKEENKNETNSDEEKLNNIYLYYIEKIKNLTYEKNKLLTCNYDFFIKINDLSQIIEEKNNIINEQLKTISSFELKVLNFEQEINSLNIKYKETSNLLKEAQEKTNELSLEKAGNIVFEDKLLNNKYNITKRQQENKIIQLNQKLDELTTKYAILNTNYEELKEANSKLINEALLKKEQLENIIKEKNQMIKDINNLQIELQLKDEQMIAYINEYQNKIKFIEENIGNSSTRKNNSNVDYEQLQILINNIYDKIASNTGNNINQNISLFVKNNINDIAKLNEINKQINLFYKNQKMYSLLTEENEKLKNHIKEIINLTLEKTNLIYLEKFKEDFTNISFEQLILKIINYIKVFKVCFLLQKIKTSLNYSEKYINWLNDKDSLKNNNSSLEELKSDINNTQGEINNIKGMLKNNSLDFDNKIKNYLTKDEIKVEINNVQKKYEKIIQDIFEYFLKYKTTKIREYESKEFLTLQIPIKSYNLMIENNMNNLSLITQSIDSWNLYVNNDLNENNDNVFQEIINMTNIHNIIEYNNMSDMIINNNIDKKDNIKNDNDNNIDEINDNYEEKENKNERESKKNNSESNMEENEIDNSNNNNENKSKENESQYSFDKKE